MRRVKRPVHRLAADGEQLRRFPAVAAKDREVDAQLPRLLRDETRLGVVARGEDRVGIRRLDRRELGFEILVAAAEFLLDGDFAAVREEPLLEKRGETHAVRRGGIGQHGDVLRLERVLGEERHHRALKRINEADAENEVADLRDLGIRRAGRNHRHLGVLTNRRGLERPPRRDLAEDRDDLVARHELAHHAGRLALLGLRVLGDQLELPAQHPARRVQLLDGEQRALVRRLSKRGLLARQRRELTDLDHGRRAAGAAGTAARFRLVHLVVTTRGQQDHARRRQERRKITEEIQLHNVPVRSAI